MKNILLTLILLCALAARATEPCTVIHPAHAKPRPGAQSIWGETSKFWQNGTILNVGWIGGTRRQHDAAWKRFQAVDALVGVTFTQKPGRTQIRCSFGPSGHWSYLGRDVLNIPAGQPTMNLQLDASLIGGDSSSEWDRVAIHEILHALGMSHELQSPVAGVPWNVPAVLAYYHRTQGWSDQQIHFQVLDRYTGTQFNGTAFDPASIMCYPVEPALTTNGFSVGWNDRLSPMDLAFLARIYPLNH